MVYEVSSTWCVVQPCPGHLVIACHPVHGRREYCAPQSVLRCILIPPIFPAINSRLRFLVIVALQNLLYAVISSWFLQTQSTHACLQMMTTTLPLHHCPNSNTMASTDQLRIHLCSSRIHLDVVALVAGLVPSALPYSLLLRLLEVPTKTPAGSLAVGLG